MDIYGILLRDIKYGLLQAQDSSKISYVIWNGSWLPEL